VKEDKKMTAKIQRWFKVAVFLLTREDSTLSICDERRRACLYASSTTSGLGTIKALVWMMISIAISLSLALL
jgi:hypothetical protein